MPKAKVPSGPFAIVGAWSPSIRPPGATPMMPSFWTTVVAAPPIPMVPSTVMVPELVTGPLSESAAWPDVSVAATVSEPLFCRPDEIVKLGNAVRSGVGLPAVDAAALMVRLLPADTVSSPMEDDPVKVTVALPAMHALTATPFGTPVLQLAAEPQSPDAPSPTQLSLQLSVALGAALPKTVDDASNTVVVPATTSSPATTAPARRATGRWVRRKVPGDPASRRPTLPSLGPSPDERPFACAQLGVPRFIVSAAPRQW